MYTEERKPRVWILAFAAITWIALGLLYGVFKLLF